MIGLIFQYMIFAGFLGILGQGIRLLMRISKIRTQKSIYFIRIFNDEIFKNKMRPNSIFNIYKIITVIIINLSFGANHCQTSSVPTVRILKIHTDSQNTVNYEVERNTNITVDITRRSTESIKTFKRTKNYAYHPISFGTIAGVSGVAPAAASVVSVNLTLDADEVYFVIHVITPDSGAAAATLDSIVIKFVTVKYWKGMPTAGINLAWYKNKKEYYFAPVQLINNSIGSKDTVKYQLIEENNLFTPSAYIGYAAQYVYAPNFSIGFTAGLNYNFGTNTNPLGPYGGVNFVFGNKYKVNFGVIGSLTQIEFVPKNYINTTVKAIGYAPPALPTKYKKWELGRGINFGFTVAL